MVAKYLALAALIGSACWFGAKPEWEPAVAIITAFGAYVAADHASRRKARAIVAEQELVYKAEADTKEIAHAARDNADDADDSDPSPDYSPKKYPENHTLDSLLEAGNARLSFLEKQHLRKLWDGRAVSFVGEVDEVSGYWKDQEVPRISVGIRTPSWLRVEVRGEEPTSYAKGLRPGDFVKCDVKINWEENIGSPSYIGEVRRARKAK